MLVENKNNVELSSSFPFKVQLDEFEGPLDLLLHLIKENKIDIFNIPISFITVKYLEYMEAMKELDLDVSGEFLVMAATLIHIKSKMLLPDEAEESEDDDTADPRDELVKKLLEYQSFKEAAKKLGVLADKRSRIYTRPKVSMNLHGAVDDEDDLNMSLFSLVQAFSSLLRRQQTQDVAIHEVFEEEISIEERIEYIKNLLKDRKNISFNSMFGRFYSKNFLIASFFAILELSKQKFLTIRQDGVFGEIYLSIKEESADA